MKKEIKLPKPQDERGYTGKEQIEICLLYNIKLSEYYEALGVNTVIKDDEKGYLIYPCDVLNALNFIMNGKYLFF